MVLMCLGVWGTNTNDGYLSHFVHSDNQFVFTMAFEYIYYMRGNAGLCYTP